MRRAEVVTLSALLLAQPGCASLAVGLFASRQSVYVTAQVRSVEVHRLLVEREAYSVRIEGELEGAPLHRVILWVPDEAPLPADVRRLCTEGGGWGKGPDGWGWTCDCQQDLSEPGERVALLVPGESAAGSRPLSLEGEDLVLRRERRDQARVRVSKPSSVPTSPLRRLAWVGLPVAIALDVCLAPVELVFLISLLTYDGPWP